jgi:PhoPQ-activated pathogenicity-related protein
MCGVTDSATAPFIKTPLATVLIAAVLLTLCGFSVNGAETALDRYVHQPDLHYRYELVKETRGLGYKASVLSLTSQQYLTFAEVDQPIWKHWLTIIQPNQVKGGTALLMIRGGESGDPAPQPDPLAARIAVMTGAVVATLNNVPNQPLTFRGETKGRVEDGIIAYTWDKFLRTGDETWPLRLPMTKAAVRAMDAVSSFTKRSGIAVDHFVVTGESKRGWTTWTTAAVDPRVIAIMPEVIDLLNIQPSFLHHYRVYGKFSNAIDDYLRAGILDWTNTAEYQKLMKIEEPFEYRERLTMPKFLINAAGDQFFLPDSSQFYWDQLKGEKYLRYVPNADHAIRDNTDVGDSMAAYFESIVRGTPRPQFTWHVEPDGSITVDSRSKPSAVKLWRATNAHTRDFRVDTIGRADSSLDLQPASPGHYVARVPKPPTGYTAFFIELTFPAGDGHPFKFTTGVKVVPDVYPFPAPRFRTPAGSHPANTQK